MSKRQPVDKSQLLTDLSPLVRATVGSTLHVDRLQEFLSAARNIEPLPADIQEEIVKLHYHWSDEVDMQAEPWPM